MAGRSQDLPDALLNTTSQQSGKLKDMDPTGSTDKHLIIIKIKWWTLFKKITALYSQHHMKSINILPEKNAELPLKQVVHIVSYQSALKG